MRFVGAMLVLSIAAIAIPARAESAFEPAPRSYRAFATTVPMRDGKSLAADVYVPRDDRRVSTVLIQTPYDRTLLRRWFAGTARYGAESMFTDARFAFVVTDWRGRFGSQTAAAQGVRPGGSEDGFDTVAWIAAQPFSNGRVGTWGPSALGGAQYRTAIEQPPALVCAVPVVMPLNLDYDVYFPGGAMWEEFATTLGRLGWPVRDRLAANPANGLFWRAASAMTSMSADDIDVPMLLVGGWFDIYVDEVIETYATLRREGGGAARSGSRLVIGPWLHMTDQSRNGDLEFPGAENAGVAHAARFLAHCLDGAGNAPSDSIAYFQMGADEWRTTEVWPPAGTVETSFYLEDARALALGKPAGAGSATFRYDPRDPVPTHGGHVLTPSLPSGPRDVRERIEARADVVSFTTAALGQPVELTGEPVARLFIASDRTDTDFTVWLTDVYPDGRSIMLTEGILRMRFHTGTDRERLIEPGVVYPIDVRMTHLAQTFLPGHRIRLLVSSSNHPKYARNLNDGEALYREGDGVVATNTVSFGGDTPSALVLPLSPSP